MSGVSSPIRTPIFILGRWYDEETDHFEPKPLQACRSPYCECSVGACTHPGFFDARGTQRFEARGKQREAYGLAMLRRAFKSGRDKPVSAPDSSQSPFSVRLFGGGERTCAASAVVPNRMVFPRPAGGLSLDCALRLEFHKRIAGPFEIRLFVGEHKLMNLRVDGLPAHFEDGDTLHLSGTFSIASGEVK
jgi:hypothetical protein